MVVRRRSQTAEADADYEPDRSELVERRRPRRRTSNRSAASLPEGGSKADVSEPDIAAAAKPLSVKRKLEVSELGSAEPATPKVPGAITLGQQNLRSPLLPRPAALPPRPKLRQVCLL
jgi:hypothetical protein